MNATPKADWLIASTELYLVSIGPGGRSSGEVYALTMPSGFTLGLHEKMVASLVKVGFIRETAGRFLVLSDLGLEMFAAIMQREKKTTP